MLEHLKGGMPVAGLSLDWAIGRKTPVIGALAILRMRLGQSTVSQRQAPITAPL